MTSPHERTNQCHCVVHRKPCLQRVSGPIIYSWLWMMLRVEQINNNKKPDIIDYYTKHDFRESLNTSRLSSALGPDSFVMCYVWLLPPRTPAHRGACRQSDYRQCNCLIVVSIMSCRLPARSHPKLTRCWNTWILDILHDCVLIDVSHFDAKPSYLSVSRVGICPCHA